MEAKVYTISLHFRASLMDLAQDMAFHYLQELSGVLMERVMHMLTDYSANICRRRLL